jgi:hypothetical protein
MVQDIEHYETGSGDILRIEGNLIPPIDPVLDQLLERGKRERVKILSGTESPSAATRKPYARTSVSLAFKNEHDLRECVRLLRWSDERLKARPDQLLLWDWNVTFREGMEIQFGVNWYDKNFFELRKEAFQNPQHAAYYAAFGAKASDFKLNHQIL